MTTIAPPKPLSVLLVQIATDIRFELDRDPLAPTDLSLDEVIEAQTRTADLDQWKNWAQWAGVEPPAPQDGALSGGELYRLRCAVKVVFYIMHPEIKAQLRGNERVQSKLAA